MTVSISDINGGLKIELIFYLDARVLAGIFGEINLRPHFPPILLYKVAGTSRRTSTSTL